MHYSASNAHAVSSSVPVGCANACRTHIPGSSWLVDTGVPHSHTGCAYTNAGHNPNARSAYANAGSNPNAGCAHANAGCDPNARGADTGGCYRAYDTSFGYAYAIAINDGARGYGSET